jgi:hypothetical protein
VIVVNVPRAARGVGRVGAANGAATSLRLKKCKICRLVNTVAAIAAQLFLASTPTTLVIGGVLCASPRMWASAVIAESWLKKCAAVNTAQLWDGASMSLASVCPLADYPT